MSWRNACFFSANATTPAANETAKSKAVEALSLSSAVFVENQGQWADSSIRYAYNGQGINVGFTDTGPVLEVLQRSLRLLPPTRYRQATFRHPRWKRPGDNVLRGRPNGDANRGGSIGNIV